MTDYADDFDEEDTSVTLLNLEDARAGVRWAGECFTRARKELEK